MRGKKILMMAAQKRLVATANAWRSQSADTR
jgi:hypothetical protein